MDSNQIIGYTASGTTVVAYGIQFVHIARCGSVEGISLPRTLLDTASLVLWVLYATRMEDLPLLIATSCELLMSLFVGVIVLQHQWRSPPAIQEGPPNHSAEVCVVYVKPQL